MISNTQSSANIPDHLVNLRQVAAAADQRIDIINKKQEIEAKGTKAKLKMPYGQPNSDLVQSAENLRVSAQKIVDSGYPPLNYVTNDIDFYTAQRQSNLLSTSLSPKTPGVYDKHGDGIYENPATLKKTDKYYQTNWSACKNSAQHEKWHKIQREELGDEEFTRRSRLHLTHDASRSFAYNLSGYSGVEYVEGENGSGEYLPNNILETGVETACAIENRHQVDPSFVQFAQAVNSGDIQPYMDAGIIYDPDAANS